ncbi:holin [Lactobacillus taiwanensis]|uniref:holin n=1 Tax=Lactobacillus TaxID=1578 RepID=UPI001FD790DF|nr:MULTISPECIES: holin [Lactobacillus]MCR1903321.1 holin [Lactobacillus taiwanensis]
MKLDINLIWAIVVLSVAGMATAYSLNKQKLEKLKLTHPKLAIVLETAGELALKAATYQASLDDKEGVKKLYDATDEVYNQLKRLYPNVPIDRDTVRNYVQHAYDFDIKNSQPKTNVKLDGSDLASHMQSVLGSTNVIADSIDKK